MQSGQVVLDLQRQGGRGLQRKRETSSWSVTHQQRPRGQRDRALPGHCQETEQRKSSGHIVEVGLTVHGRIMRGCEAMMKLVESEEADVRVDVNLKQQSVMMRESMEGSRRETFVEPQR